MKSKTKKEKKKIDLGNGNYSSWIKLNLEAEVFKSYILSAAGRKNIKINGHEKSQRNILLYCITIRTIAYFSLSLYL